MLLNIELIKKDILNWYEEKWNDKSKLYPWRLGEVTPYRILIAEILLQHTTAKGIKDSGSYIKMIEKYPNIYALNNSLKEDLIELFKPLGLYNQKSERIKKLSKYIVDELNGKIPESYEELVRVPLIGDYIANAILTFAFNKNEPPIDGNLKRIALNVWKIKEKKKLKELYRKLADSNPKLTYWALFDIGWFHCRKPRPNCLGCPFSKYCDNYNKD